MNYEFNGMLDSVLPNLYINRITLEQKNTQPLTNNKYDMTPHIDQTILPKGPGGNAAPSLTPDYGGFEDKLKVTFDLFLEIPNIDSDGFWQEVFSAEFSKYLSANIILFSGEKAKQYYKYLVGQPSDVWKNADISVQDVASYLNNSWIGETYDGPVPNWPLVPATEYKHISESSLFDHLLSPGLFLAPSDGGDTSDAQKLAHIKQKYAKTLPDGTVVHKVPIRMTAELDGAFPTSLAAIAYCGVNPPQDLWEDASATLLPIGRAATEVIIQNGKVEQKGMIFFVSAKQDSSAFESLKGQLWFGGVHKMLDADGNDRYAAGNTHSTSKHPFLDYVMVPNQRIQDFRQIAIMQKHIANFNPVTELVFGGEYTDLRSTPAGASFDKYGIFSNLLPSVGAEKWLGPKKGKRTKLFFSVDWGKLLKKHCAIPAVLDRLASSTEPSAQNQLLNIMNQSAVPVSFKVYRERLASSTATRAVDIKNKASLAINRLNRELIYDKFPALYYWKNNWKKDQVASSLVPIKLDPNAYSFNGFERSYSLTDYDVGALSSGLFRYSVEIEIFDPTIQYFTFALAVAQQGVDTLKEYTYLANGTGSKLGAGTPEYYWNSYLGKFEEGFLNKAVSDIGFTLQQGAPPLAPQSIRQAMAALDIMMQLARTDWTRPESAINTDDTEPLPTGWKESIKNMLNPSTASPDSITAVYEIFDTLTSQLSNFINSFSTSQIPKVDGGEFCCDEGGNTFSGSPLLQTKSPVTSATPQKNIVITHTFGDPTELVDTRRLDAGYDVFADIGNIMVYESGLKTVNLAQFSQKSLVEHQKYFKGNGTFQVDVAKNSTPENVWTSESSVTDALSIPTSVFTVNENYFYLPDGSPPSPPRWTLFTRLPKSIKDSHEENAPWKLINNIIRYKLGLSGNPGEESWLGYGGPNAKSKDQIPGSQFIDDDMERILKEYQSLASMGANFIHEHQAFWGKGKEGPFGGQGAFQNTPSGLPYYGDGSNELETLKQEGSLVPWAKDVKQERFLLALAIQQYCDLKYFDKKLGSYNTAAYNSRIWKFLTSFSGTAFTTGTQQASFSEMLSRLPPQVKVLIGSHSASNTSLIQKGKNYSVTNKLYKDAGDGSVDNKSLVLGRFGEFWYNHQNLMVVEYLSGYATVSQIPVPVGGPLTKFENKYNATIKTPIWKSLTNDAVGGNGLLLCRIKKLRYPFFNQRLYGLLDMPLYDEYFFLNLNPTGLVSNNHSPTHSDVYSKPIGPWE